MTASNAISGLQIFCAGAAHIDRKGVPSGRFERGASNPGTWREAVGGAVFNAGGAMHDLGARVALLSARGGDTAGVRVAETVAASGMDDLSITWLDRASASYTAILDHEGGLVGAIADMAIYDRLGARALSRRHLRDAMARSDALVLDANLPAGAIDALAAAFAGRLVAALGVSPAKAVRLSDRLDAISLLFLSRAEAAAILGESVGTSVDALAAGLGARGARRAVVTDGPREAAILDGSTLLLQVPPSVERIADVTGAGDTLAGVATLAVLAGSAMIEGVRLGMTAAARRISPDTDNRPAMTMEALHAVADALPPARPADAP